MCVRIPALCRGDEDAPHTYRSFFLCKRTNLGSIGIASFRQHIAFPSQSPHILNCYTMFLLKRSRKPWPHTAQKQQPKQNWKTKTFYFTQTETVSLLLSSVSLKPRERAPHQYGRTPGLHCRLQENRSAAYAVSKEREVTGTEGP